MPHPRPTVCGSSSSLSSPIAHPAPPPMRAPPVAPMAVYFFCSGVQDEHDETVKSATVVNTPTQFFHLYTKTPPWVSDVSAYELGRFCHLWLARSIESMSQLYTANSVTSLLQKEAAAAPEGTAVGNRRFSLRST